MKAEKRAGQLTCLVCFAIVVLQTHLVRLTPSTIMHLFALEKLARFPDCLTVVVRVTGQHQAFHGEHGSIREADRPRAEPAPIVPLRT